MITSIIAAALQVANPAISAPVDNSAMQASIDAAARAAADAKTRADAAVAAASAVEQQIPKPATTVPPTEMVGGTMGTAGTYRPADAAAPRITRAGVVTTTAATGDWSITWSTPLMAVPVVYPIPVNSTTQPIICNVTTRLMTGASGRCWFARTLPATLLSLSALITFDVFGAAASGVTVQVLAIPPTQ